MASFTRIFKCALVNTRRIYYLSIIAIPLRIINLFAITSTKSYDTLVLININDEYDHPVGDNILRQLADL